MSTLLVLQSGAAQGLLWALLTLGVYITYRLLDFADLTVEGSFPLGAAVTAILINQGMNPFAVLFIAFLVGSIAGLATGILNTVCKIPPILSGILTMIALYSINLRIMSGKATITIQGDTVKTLVNNLLPLSNNLLSIIAGIIINLLIVILLYVFFGTEIGCSIRATGHNPYMARALGVHTGHMTILGLMISNGLVALSGSLVSQLDYGSALVTMGQGSIVIGLASVIIGEVIFCHKDHSFAYKLTAVVFGAVIYRTIIAFALRVNILEATDLKLITAVVVSIALSLPVIKNSIAERKKRIANNKNEAAAGGESRA